MEHPGEIKDGVEMSDGCTEYGRDTCSGCSRFWSCEKVKGSREALEEIKLFEHEHEGKRYRKSYGKRKRRSAAMMKVKR